MNIFYHESHELRNNSQDEEEQSIDSLMAIISDNSEPEYTIQVE